MNAVGSTPVCTRPEAAAWLRRWLVETALPFWADVGFDRRRGGFHERLQLDGTPDLAAPRRTMAQARQIYVYAHAAVLGWFPEGKALALEALEFLLANCRSVDGKPGYVNRLAPDNSVLDPLRDTYAHAFVLLAFAWLARASGDAQVRGLIDEALAFFDEHLAAPDGTLFEGVPACEPRRQNPHMHAYEAMLALHETIGHPTALARAQSLRDLLSSRFFGAETGTIGEYFANDWSRWPDPKKDCVEPGHHAEWSWLIDRHTKLAGLPADPLSLTLLETAQRFAEPNTGFIPDEVDRSGAVLKSSRRCWPQTELAKALLRAGENGDEAATATAQLLLYGIACEYVGRPVPGAWIDHFDASGKSIAEYIPASTFYHLFGAIAEADRVLA